MRSNKRTSSNAPPATFGLAVLCVCTTLGWLTWRGTGSGALGGSVFGAGVLFAACYYGNRAWRPRLSGAVLTLVYPIRWLATQCVLLVSFLGVVVPVSLWFRLSGRSLYAKEQQDGSSWQPVDPQTETDSFFRTF